MSTQYSLALPDERQILVLGTDYLSFYLVDKEGRNRRIGHYDTFDRYASKSFSHTLRCQDGVGLNYEMLAYIDARHDPLGFKLRAGGHTYTIPWGVIRTRAASVVRLDIDEQVVIPWDEIRQFVN